MMRLDKYLCETGFGTRSQVKDLLKKGQVMVNGEVVKKPELKINETTDQILCQGKKASYQKNIYLCSINRRVWYLQPKTTGRKRCWIL